MACDSSSATKQQDTHAQKLDPAERAGRGQAFLEVGKTASGLLKG